MDFASILAAWPVITFIVGQGIAFIGYLFKLNGRVSAIESKVSELESDNKDLQAQIKAVDLKHDSLKESMHSIEIKLTQLTTQVEIMGKSLERILNLIERK